VVNNKIMKKIIQLSCAVVSAFGLWACSGDDNKNSGAEISQPVTTFTNSERGFGWLTSNFFKPDSGDYKGIVVFGSGNDPEDPTQGDMHDAYLVSLSQKLAGQGYLVAIVQYRDEPAVGANWENWTSNVEMLSYDLSDTGNFIAEEFGLERSDIILGGSSYAANALLSNSAWGNVLQGTKGFIAIMGSCAVDTAQNIKLPVLTYACKEEPYNTHYGKSLYDNIQDNDIKTLSYGMTDNSCSGHSTSNNWQDDIVGKVKAWLP